MPRNFNFGGRWNVNAAQIKSRRVQARAVLALLLVANLAAAVIAFKPWGGSAEDLRRQQEQLRQQLLGAQARLARTKALVQKVEQARKAGDQFLAEYTVDRRKTFSTIMAELGRAAQEAGIKTRESAMVLDPVEGSDTLYQMTITAGFEGTYANLTKFVNLLDKSPRFLIIESMQASPQQSGATLNVSFKLDTFVKEEPGGTS